MKVIFSLMLFTLLSVAFSFAQITSTYTSFWWQDDLTSPAITTWWDVNGDNYYDVAIATQSNGKPYLKVIKNDGSTLWTYSSTLSGKANWVSFEDMDDDNDKDLAVAAGSRAWVFKDNGSTLSSNPDWTVTTTGANIVTWGNYNNDDYIDLAVAMDGYVKIYNGLYNGTISTTANWSWSFSGGTVTSLDFGKLDESYEQRQSLAVGIEGADEEGDGVYVFENTGSTLPSSPSWTNYNATVAIFGDFDNDEDDDLFTNQASSTLNARVYLSSNGSITSSYINAVLDPNVGGFSSQYLLVSDFNSDGYNDLALKCIWSAAAPWSPDFDTGIMIYYNNSGSSFKTDYFYLPTTDTPSPAPEKYYFGNISAEDLNNDGDLELFNGYYYEDYDVVPWPPVLENKAVGVNYFENQGDAAPAPPQNLYVDFNINNHPIVHWDANTERDLKGYHVYRDIPRISLGVRLTTTPITATYYVDDDYVQGQSYPAYYYTKAVDQNNNLSAISNYDYVWVMPTKYIGNPGGTALIPMQYGLLENYPNPFNPSTTIGFALPEDGNTSITIYAITGERVKTLLNQFMEKGIHTVEWNGRNQNGNPVSSGIYLYELVTGQERQVKKMFLAK